MKRIITPWTMALALAAVVAIAQPAVAVAQDLTKDEIKAVIEAARSEMRASREQLLGVNLALTTEESDRFWPLYREYSNKKAELGDERLRIIMAYAEAYPDVDDATAKSLIDRHLKYVKDMNALRARYATKFGKTLPATKFVRFLQIESRIDNLVELQIQGSIPLIEPAN